MVQFVEVDVVAVSVVLPDAVIEQYSVSGQAGQGNGRGLPLQVSDDDFQAAFSHVASDYEGFRSRIFNGRCCHRGSSGQEKKSEEGKE